MFGLFKKQVHEPLELQKADLDNYPPEFSKQIINGEDCDELSQGYGEFGSLTNPIPVNGSLGEIKYLGKLRGESGNALFFHRIGSLNSPATDNSVDLYEVVCMDATQWNKLHFSMYHPRRSNKAPIGYSLMPFNKSLNMDMPFAYGVNSLVSDFPFSLPEAIVEFYGESPGLTFARHAQDKIDKFNFGKNDDLTNAESHLIKETGLSLDKIPNKEQVIELFESMSEQGNLSSEAQTSLLYRLVVFNYLGAAKLMRDDGKNTPPDKLIWLTDVLNKSVDWSEKAQDHVTLEQLSSQLNMNIERFLESFGIRRG
jgi:hypothetical protein